MRRRPVGIDRNPRFRKLGDSGRQVLVGARIVDEPAVPVTLRRIAESNAAESKRPRVRGLARLVLSSGATPLGCALPGQSKQRDAGEARDYHPARHTYEPAGHPYTLCDPAHRCPPGEDWMRL